MASASDRYSPLGRTFQDIVSFTSGYVRDAGERINPDAHADEIVLMTLASVAAADRFVPTDPAATFNERRYHQAARNLHFYLNGVGQPSTYTPTPNA